MFLFAIPTFKYHSMTNKTKAHLAIFAANLLYGINYFAVKQIVPHNMHPYALSVLRACGALLLLSVASFFFKRQKIERADIWKLALAGLLGVSINQTLLVTGLNYASSINASVIMTSNPMFVMIISAIVLRQSITWLKTLGIVLGAVGTLIIITTSGKISFHSDYFLGDSIILINAVMYALYLVWVTPLMKKYDSFTVMYWMFVYGSIFVSIFGCAWLVDVNFAVLPMQVWLALIFVIVGATFLTYLLNIYGLQHVSPTTVSIYIYMQPLIASLLTLAFAGEAIGMVKILAMSLVFVGVYLVSRSK